MSNSALDQLEQQLERSIENVRQIQIIVSDFQPQGQPGLNQVIYEDVTIFKSKYFIFPYNELSNIVK